MRRLAFVTAALMLASLGWGTAVVPAVAGPGATVARAVVASGSPEAYLVVLRQAPAASYRGGVRGYPRTAPAAAEQFDARTADVTRYQGYLRREQQTLLRRIGHPELIYSYTTALNGFAALLTPEQVKRLDNSPAVLLVQPDRLLKVAGTAAHGHGGATGIPAAGGTSPGSAAPTALWRQIGGAHAAGRGVVIGVIDSGVWPDNPSLAGIPISASTRNQTYPGFSATCQPGVHWSVDTCNSKIVAAHWFVRGFGRANVAQSDYLSARDGSGHGTSVASIAAGNAGVDTRIDGQDFGHISGQAPAAGLSIYKACWTAPDPAQDGCDLADTIKAVDQAVSDGVGVISASIASSATTFADPLQLAFLNAAAANVFVAAPAGNSGPALGSVQQPAPWVTTVGASTKTVFQGGVQLGNGRTLVGAMLSNRRVGPAPLLLARDVAAPGVAPSRAALCYPGSLDARQVERAIVVCDRGVTSRVSKSAAVARAGGRGMVLLNTSPGSVDADVHHVPTVHLDVSAAAHVRAYVKASAGGAFATLLPAATTHPPTPAVARFSGRGPSDVSDGNFLKPNLTAPGVDVVSATAPAEEQSQQWAVVSGTSFAASEVAGVAADVEAARPSWTPAVIQSAMMTTARPMATSSGPLARGAGQLHPAGVLRPGLVYPTGVDQWAQLLKAEGVRLSGYVPSTAKVTASGVNAASIAVGDLVGTRMVRRTVTNVGDRTATYTAMLKGLRGVSGAVTPSSLTLAPGRSATYTVTFTATRFARYGSFTGGSLMWRSSSAATVTSPVVVRPQLAAPPGEVSGHGRTARTTISGVAGVTGTLHLATSGLVGATPVQLALRPGDFDPTAPATSSSTAMETLRVPSSARAARFQVSGARPGDDLDVYVYRGSSLVASATDRAGDETVTLTRPQAGPYRVFVNAHRSARPLARASFTTWVLPRTQVDNLLLDRRVLHVVGGEHFTVQASWSGLDPRQRWWGYLAWRGLSGVTYLTVN